MKYMKIYDEDEGFANSCFFYRKSPLIELKLKIAGSFNSVGPDGYPQLPKSCPLAHYTKNIIHSAHYT